MEKCVVMKHDHTLAIGKKKKKKITRALEKARLPSEEHKGTSPDDGVLIAPF